MTGKVDLQYDKKKNVYENFYDMYDQLFQRNIAHHKTITKYLFNSSKDIVSKCMEKVKKKKAKNMPS